MPHKLYLLYIMIVLAFAGAIYFDQALIQAPSMHLVKEARAMGMDLYIARLNQTHALLMAACYYILCTLPLKFVAGITNHHPSLVTSFIWAMLMYWLTNFCISGI